MSKATKITAEEYYKDHPVYQFVKYDSEKTDYSYKSSIVKYTIKCKKAGHEFTVSGNTKNGEVCKQCEKDEKPKKESKSKKADKKEEEVKPVEEVKEETKPEVEEVKEEPTKEEVKQKFTLVPETYIVHLSNDIEDEYKGVKFTTIEDTDMTNKDSVYIPKNHALIIDDMVFVHGGVSLLSMIASNPRQIKMITDQSISHEDVERQSRNIVKKDITRVKKVFHLDLHFLEGYSYFNKLLFTVGKKSYPFYMLDTFAQLVEKEKLNPNSIGTVGKDTILADDIFKKKNTNVEILIKKIVEWYDPSWTESVNTHAENSEFVKFYLSAPRNAKTKAVKDFKKLYIDSNYTNSLYVCTKVEINIFKEKLFDWTTIKQEIPEVKVEVKKEETPKVKDNTAQVLDFDDLV